MNGRVYLVGAGPGDPGLLTARALELIAGADVILYDRLAPAAALDGARADAELVFVGKQGGGESVPQERTEELIVARAREGKTVVRLKGGDPFVFGRGGEEAARLREEGIAYEIVPGITAGIAAPAYAGIPVTHRGLATAVAFVTGHTRADGPRRGQSRAGEEGSVDEDHTRGDPDKPGDPDTRGDPDTQAGLDWPALAAFPGTLVFYMGVGALPVIAQALIAAGRPGSEPAAVVERGTLTDQRTISGTLATIADAAQAEGVRAPAITVVGPVAGLAPELGWLPPPAERPLLGVTVTVTRARARASGLARRLEALGARVVQAPMIRTVPLPGPPLDLAPYDLLCLTSPVGVATLFERLHAGGRDARALHGIRVAAIGPGTAQALSAHGVTADVMPERAVAEGLLDALTELQPPVRRALLARAREGRDVLPDGLRKRGVEVDVVALYETVAETPPEHVLQEALAADCITFTSASTVRFFIRAISAHAGLSPRTRIVSIGPVTSEALRELGLEPHVEAERHDIDGLIEALLGDAAAERKAR